MYATRVAALAAVALADGERAETSQLHAAALDHGFADGVEHCIHGVFDILSLQVAKLRLQLENEFRPQHCASPPYGEQGATIMHRIASKR